MVRQSTLKKNTMTKECIYTALLLLMEQKPYEDISITEIANKAGVSRMSYYRLYSSKDDILEQRCHELFEECLDRMKKEGKIDHYRFATGIFEACGEHHELLESLLHARLHDLVQKNLLRYCTYLAEFYFEMDINDKWTDYWIYTVSGKISMLISRWIEKGMPESPEEMAYFLVNNKF